VTCPTRSYEAPQQISAHTINEQLLKKNRYTQSGKPTGFVTAPGASELNPGKENVTYPRNESRFRHFEENCCKDAEAFTEPLRQLLRKKASAQLALTNK
jgi:hypothetical protein